jgi:hypothetical protein
MDPITFSLAGAAGIAVIGFIAAIFVYFENREHKSK